MDQKIRESNNISEKVNKAQSEKYKSEKCKVLLYNEKTKELDIEFKGYGIRLNNISNINSDFVSVKYSGEICTPNFHCKV